MRAPRPRGLAFWLTAAAIAGVNAGFHVVATIRARSYSPGVVTGVLLYLPLAIAGLAWLGRHGLVAPATIAQAVVIAALYQLWSTWQHRRHAVRAPAAPQVESRRSLPHL